MYLRKTSTMTSTNTNNTNTGSSSSNGSSGSKGSQALKPFEWLSGGLFFGRSQKDGIKSVDSCKDPAVLIGGIQDSFQNLLKQEQATAAQPEGSSDGQGGASADSSATAPATQAQKPPPSSSPDEPTDGAFLEARLARLQFLLYDERRTTSQQDLRWSNANTSVATSTAQTLVQATFGDDGQSPLVAALVRHLPLLQFESRKHVASIVNYLLVCGLDGSDADLYIPIMVAFVQFVERSFDPLMSALLRGYVSKSTTSDVALHCGSIYRSCLKHVLLYRQLVSSPERVRLYVYPFLDTLVHVPNFDISSDAMESLRHVLTAGCADSSGAGGSLSGPTNTTSSTVAAMAEETSRELARLSAEFLTRDYSEIWEKRFNPKLMSDQANYMTKRVALQILSLILLTRSNYAIMIQYVNSRTNLVLVMKLLRDTSPHITLDAFHVFKVFVANPSKIPEVVKILKDNQDKLCRYLETLHKDREASDTQFRDEKALIINTIRGL